MTTSVIFLCPHNAAKSVAAAAYFERAAAERGLDVAITTAGTEPDEIVMPAVRSHLEQQGYLVDAVPRLVEPGDLTVDHVVNMGCDLGDLAVGLGVERWDDVPTVSDGVEASLAAIEMRAAELADRIAAARRSAP